MDIALQIIFVVGAVALAFWVTGITARRLGSRSPAPLPEGIVLITGPESELSRSAEEAISAAGGSFSTISVLDKRADELRVRSLPVGLVVRHGEVIMRRAGRSVIDDAPDLVAATDPTIPRSP